MLDTQAAEALPLTGELTPDPMLVYLVVSNLFIGALLIVILVLCATQRTNYKRQLRAAKVNAFGKNSIKIYPKQFSYQISINSNSNNDCKSCSTTCSKYKQTQR